jgi:hypothetical protein
MPGDLVSGGYPLNQALQSFLGRGGQKAQSNLPVRSNLEWPVYSGPLVDTAGASVAASGVAVAVPVPVDIGMEISNISWLVGATGATAPTHGFSALYSGTTVAAPPLIAQTPDILATAVPATTRLDSAFAVGSQVIVTPAMAPNGFLYAVYSATVTTTLPSLITTPDGAAAAQYRWFANGPLFFAQTAGSALGGVAAPTLIEASALTVAPVCFLW